MNFLSKHHKNMQKNILTVGCPLKGWVGFITPMIRFYYWISIVVIQLIWNPLLWEVCASDICREFIQYEKYMKHPIHFVQINIFWSNKLYHYDDVNHRIKLDFSWTWICIIEDDSEHWILDFSILINSRRRRYRYSIGID